MKKIYLPFIVEKSNEIIERLKTVKFFDELDDDGVDVAREIFCRQLTEKFVSNGLEEELEDIFTEDEYLSMFGEIMAATTLIDLKKKGFVESYEDENTPETFFLTEKGKNLFLDKNKPL